jgi:polyferredoxin
VLRPRILVYAGLLLTLVTGFIVTVAVRNPVGIDILHDRNALYRITSDGNIENVYTVRLLNKDSHNHRFTLSASGLPGLTVDTNDPRPMVAAGHTLAIPVRLRAPRTGVTSSKVSVRAIAVDNEHLNADAGARFISPGN